MFLRVTTYQHDKERQPDIKALVATKTEQVRAIDGLLTVDVFESAPDQGVIVAVYEDEAAFNAAAAEVRSILGELAALLTAPPTTLSGTSFWTTRE